MRSWRAKHTAHFPGGGKHALRLRNEWSPPELLTSLTGDRDAEQTRTVLSKRRAKNGGRGLQQPFYRLCIQMRAAWRLVLVGWEEPLHQLWLGGFFPGTNQSECTSWQVLYHKFFHLQPVFLLQYFEWVFFVFSPSKLWFSIMLSEKPNLFYIL
jgi:hypothetical protein